MKPEDYVIHIVLSMILIVGAYQFYFWCQRNVWFAPREFKSRIDEKIPYWPGWVWIYSFLYYPAILYINLIVGSPRHFAHAAFSFILLLFAQMVCFQLFPVVTPSHWRTLNNGNSLSERFLQFVRKFDKESNCFPSMHTSVAMLTAMHALPIVGPWAFLFPVLIGISCLFTKQHYLLDLPAGALLGYLAYDGFRWVY